VASHELRTPLTILLGLTDLAARSNRAAEPLAGWIDRMNKAGLRLQHLVDQVVTMLAAQHYERPLDTRPTDLASLARRALDDVRPFAEARHHTLAADLPDDLGQVDVDEQKIRDSINHLLLNAIKFTPDGGRITVGARREDDGGARVWVSDTGVGMDETACRHVFDKFFTDFDVSCHSSGHFEYGKRGIGLGLSVVKAFVEMHKGAVDVESEPGQGTTFTIRLPANA
jgi:signal transduction histidine kinase